MHQIVKSRQLGRQVTQKRKEAEEARPAVGSPHKAVHAVRETGHLRIRSLEPLARHHGPEDVEHGRSERVIVHQNVAIS